MPGPIITYVRFIDKINRIIGRAAMYLVFYLSFLLYGGISSTTYALEYGQKHYSAWAPYLAPIKITMTFGIVMMLLQAVATFFKNVADVKGESIA